MQKYQRCACITDISCCGTLKQPFIELRVYMTANTTTTCVLMMSMGVPAVCLSAKEYVSHLLTTFGFFVLHVYKRVNSFATFDTLTREVLSHA